jgi:hypothetical protein
MGMPTTSIAQNPTSSAPVQQSGGKGGGKGMGSMGIPQPTQQMPQQPDQGYRSTIQPSSMTMSATSGQPTTGQPNPYPNTTGSWDNSTTQQSPSMPQMGGKGKGA